MLKRQLPVTPPPTLLGSPSYFFDSLAKPHLTHNPNLLDVPARKRRRVEQSVPDGTVGDHSCNPYHEESSGEEDWIDDANLGGHPPDPSSQSSPGGNEYMQTNSLLYELHVLNQHRLMFVNSDHRSAPLASLRTTNIPASTPDEKSLITEISKCPACPADMWTSEMSPATTAHEAQSVWERYEGTNRFLGSLFLSRRRELQTSFSPSVTDDTSES